MLDEWVMSLVDLLQDGSALLSKTFKDGLSFLVEALQLKAEPTWSSLSQLAWVGFVRGRRKGLSVAARYAALQHARNVFLCGR